MGSGISGNYSGTIVKSQEYAPYYTVTNDMLDKDKNDSDIYTKEKGYFKNPSATPLKNAIYGNSILFNGHKAEGTMTYVMDMDGNIIFGKRMNPNNSTKRSPHPTLIGGTEPKVQCTGMITFSNGKIVSVDNMSGHFKPNIRSLEKVEKVLDNYFKNNHNIFSKESKWRR